MHPHDCDMLAKPRLVIWEMRKSMFGLRARTQHALVKAVEGVQQCAHAWCVWGGANTAVGRCKAGRQ